MGREIIQIVVAPSGQVIALCDDSSIWIKHDGWRRLADIPQDDEKPSAYQLPEIPDDPAFVRAVEAEMKAGHAALLAQDGKQGDKG